LKELLLIWGKSAVSSPVVIVITIYYYTEEALKHKTCSKKE